MPKAHENNCSYVSSADLPSNSLCKKSMVGSYTENPEKPQTVEIGGWALVQVWVLAQDNMVCSRLQLKQPYD